MKKLLYVFALILCICAVGCGVNDFVVGQWQVSQYSYSDGITEYSYNNEQVSELVEKYITNQTQPENTQQQVEFAIAMLHSNTEGFVYNIKNDKTLEVSKDGQNGAVYTWERIENTLTLKVDDMEMQWGVDEIEQCCYYSNTFANGTVTVYLSKI